jgi:ParB family transcriptional regulator, chromosome partitioning protein
MPKRRSFLVIADDAERETARMADIEALAAPRPAITRNIPTSRIRPNPFQSRQNFSDLDELANAIRAHGFTSRLRVRPDLNESGYFQLVFGERRLRAAITAGLTEVPCEVAEHTDEDMIEIGLAENIQRRDLTPLEEAQAFQRFVDQRGYSIRQLAERIGKDKGYIENRLALLRTPDDVQEMLAQRPDAMRVAREIAKLPMPEQRQPLIAGVVAGTLNTQEVSAIVREVTTETAPPPSQEDKQPSTSASSAGATLQDRQKGTATTSPLSPTERIRKRLEREARAIRTTMTSWQTMLPTLDADERQVVMNSLEELLGMASQMIDALSEEQ